MSERPIVSVEWLQSSLSDKSVSVVDASWHLPPEQRNAGEEYLQGHIPGAVFFDIDKISTPGDLPHMMPSADFFNESVGKLGLKKNNTVVVYDTKGLFSAARVWWMLTVCGYGDVKILDGGLPAWLEAGFALDTGEVGVEPVVVSASVAPGSIVDASQVLEASETRSVQILDARSQDRFDGLAPEPRAGLRAGHIPGSNCLPFTELLSNGKLKSQVQLREILKAHGFTGAAPVYTTCGSGVTAAIITLALHCVGHYEVALYDGSWTEWGGREDLPVAHSDA